LPIFTGTCWRQRQIFRKPLQTARPSAGPIPVFENANRCLKASDLNSDNGTIQLRLTVLSIFKKI
jgi:hypothetical protein